MIHVGNPNRASEYILRTRLVLELLTEARAVYFVRIALLL